MQQTGTGGSNPIGNPLDGITDVIKNTVKEIKDSFLQNFDLTNIKNTLSKMERGATEVAKQFGQGRENIVALQAAMGDAVIKVSQMGGNFQNILTIQKEVSKELGRNVILQGETFEKLFATTEVTGQSAKQLTIGFKDAGFSVGQISEKMLGVINVAREQGVNAQAVSSKVLENMAALNKFGFENGVQGLAKMAAQATSLRIDMRTTLDMADKLFEPEKAIEMAAAMQRLGVTQSDLLDPLRLMDLAQNDPAELQNQLAEMSKQFVQLNKDGQFEIMPGARRQLREIEKELALPAGQLSKMALASAELETKMSKIIFPKDFASEDDRKMIANLAEMGEGGQYQVTFEDKEGKTVTKSVAELQPQDLEQLKKASETELSMEDLAKKQLTVNEQIRGILTSMEKRLPTALAGTRIVEEGKTAALEVYKGVGETFGGEKMQNKELRDMFQSNISEMFNLFKDGKYADGLIIPLTKTGQYINDAWGEALKNGEEELVKLANSTNPVIELMVGLGTSVGKSVLEIEKLTDKLKETPSNTNVSTFADTAKTTKVNDFIIPFEKDQLKIYNNVIVGGTNLDSNVPTPTETSQKVSGEVNVNINLTSQGIDVNTLSMALNDMTVKQQIVQAVISGMNPNINPNQKNSQLRNMEINSYNSR